MAKTLPSSASKANCDSTADDPEQALLVDLAGLVDKFNDLLTKLQPLSLAAVSSGLTLVSNASGTADDLVVACSTVTYTADEASAPASLRGKVAYYTPSTAANRTFTLQAASTYGANWHCRIVNGSSYEIQIATTGAETISGQASITLGPQDGGTLICDGTNWVFAGTSDDFVRQSQIGSMVEVSDEIELMATYSVTDTVTEAHGLSGRPQLVQLFLVCLSAEYGYSLGDYLPIDGSHTTNESRRIQVVVDATDITVVTGNDRPNITRADNNANVGITALSWKLVARCFYFG